MEESEPISVEQDHHELAGRGDFRRSGGFVITGLTSGHGVFHWFSQSFLVMLPQVQATFGLSEIGIGAIATVREMVSGIVNLPMTVREVSVSILLTAFDDTETKISLRSKPGVNSCNGMSRVVDVNALASTFGGGGHVHAAGARLSMDLARAKACVAAAVDSYFKTLAATV